MTLTNHLSGPYFLIAKAFWIGTHKGLWLFDRETNRGKKIHFKVSGLQNLSPLYIRAMAETDDHTLWLGTANYGICKVINEKNCRPAMKRSTVWLRIPFVHY